MELSLPLAKINGEEELPDPVGANGTGSLIGRSVILLVASWSLSTMVDASNA